MALDPVTEAINKAGPPDMLRPDQVEDEENAAQAALDDDSDSALTEVSQAVNNFEASATAQMIELQPMQAQPAEDAAAHGQAEVLNEVLQNPGPGAQAEQVGRDILNKNVSWLTPEQRFYTRAGFFISIFAFAVAASSAVYQYIHNAANSVPNDPANEQIDAIVQAWFNLSDSQFWSLVAAYVQKQQPSVTTQLLMCQDIIQLSPPPTQPWVWSDSDRMAIVNELVAAAQGDISAIYTKVSTETYQGQPLPRGIAAKCCALALPLTLM